MRTASERSRFAPLEVLTGVRWRVPGIDRTAWAVSFVSCAPPGADAPQSSNDKTRLHPPCEVGATTRSALPQGENAIAADRVGVTKSRLSLAAKRRAGHLCARAPSRWIDAPSLRLIMPHLRHCRCSQSWLDRATTGQRQGRGAGRSSIAATSAAAHEDRAALLPVRSSRPAYF